MSNSRPVDCVSVIGLGKLGFPIAGVYADKGYEVVGVDVNERHVAAMNEGRAPIFEPDLQELLTKNKARLSATHDCRQAVLDTAISFIIVPTPSKADGGFTHHFVVDACTSIGEALKDKDYHLVVITSTVMPGAVDGEIREVLEQVSGKKCGKDFGLCYSPEFIALGSVVRDLLFPDFLLVGQSDDRAGELISAFYKTICETNPPIARMTNVNAELAKIAVNTYMTTKISFANMLAHVCEGLPGADIDVVTRALGMDSRIGKKYLKGSLGYGGPCFPRDNAALARLADTLHVPATIARATDQANLAETDFLLAKVRKYLPEAGTVGVLGLAYKPNTDVITESPGVALVRSLGAIGIRTVGYDPVALTNAFKALDDLLEPAASVEECISKSDVIVVTTPDDAYKNLDPSLFARSGRRRVVIDCWRLLDGDQIGQVAEYVAIGRGPTVK